jgi:hypothetical protein
MDETAVVWERLEAESAEAYAAFTVYRDMLSWASRRSRDAAWLRARAADAPANSDEAIEGSGSADGTWTRWMSEHEWVSRCVAYDAYIDRGVREGHEREHIASLVGLNAESIADAGDLGTVLKLALKLATRTLKSRSKAMPATSSVAKARAALLCIGDEGTRKLLESSLDDRLESMPVESLPSMLRAIAQLTDSKLGAMETALGVDHILIEIDKAGK